MTVSPVEAEFTIPQTGAQLETPGMLAVAPFHGHLRVVLKGALALVVVGHAGDRSAVQYGGGGAPVVKVVGGNLGLGSQAVLRAS